jgi:GR25 family glycosyltransferase involved in LPS biosynthesis
MTTTTSSASLIDRLVAGQAHLMTMTAEQQDATRWQLLEELCGPSADRYRPNGFGTSDASKAEQLVPWRAELVDRALDDIGASKAHLFQSRPNGHPKILFVMTTCKRLDLCLRTLQSFVRNCLDCWRISKWVALDDGSTEEDLSSMRSTFPFLHVLSKSHMGLPKGHASSLNELWWRQGVDGGFDYIFQMEDDWQFFRPDQYITRCIKALDSLSGCRDQVLVNRSYAETVFDLCCVGGRWDPVAGCWDHDHHNPEPRAQEIMATQTNGGERGSHTYWPGFSLRPGLIRTNALRGIKPFNTDGRHFEHEFATRWPGKTSYLPEISSWHTGRLTSERHDQTHTLNAYELNGVDQFGVTVPPAPARSVSSKTTKTKPANPKAPDVSPPPTEQANAIPAPANSAAGQMTHREMHELFYKMGADRVSLSNYRPRGLPEPKPFPKSFEVWVVNLDRRADRLKKFCERNWPALENISVARLPATDGRDTVPNHHWDRLAAWGDFHHHRGMMACAMSHIRLWQHLASQDSVEWMVVMEDDVVLSPDFKLRVQTNIAGALTEHQNNQWSIVWLGFHASPHSPLWGVDFGVQGRASTLRGQVESSLDLIPAQRVVVQPWSLRHLCRQSMGGTHCYMMHKRGAQKALDHIKVNGMRNGIDWEMWHVAESFVCLPPIAHAPSPAVHSLLPELSDTDIQITAMNPKVSVFPLHLESRPLARERYHLYRLLGMMVDVGVGVAGDGPTVLHVPVSRWLAQHPSLLYAWARDESWLWLEHDVVWLQLVGGDSSRGSELDKVPHPQKEQPLLAALVGALTEELGEEVDWLVLSNRSVVAVVSPELFDEDKVNDYFLMGGGCVDLGWVGRLGVGGG